MRGKTGFLTALIFLAAGIVLIVVHDKERVMDGIVTFLGIVFIVPAVINILVSAFSRRREKTAERGRRADLAYVGMLVVSVFGIALGVAMLVATEFFAGVIVYVFAALLIAAGVYHVLAVSVLSRPFMLPPYFYVIPVLMIAAGCVILFAPTVQSATKVVVLITGIAFVASSVNTMLEYVGTHPSGRSDRLLESSSTEKPLESGQD